MISKCNFVRQWDDTNRGKSWTEYGLEALYDILCVCHTNDNTNYEDNDPLEDIVGIDCSYAEYTAETLMQEYGASYLDDEERFVYELTIEGDTVGAQKYYSNELTEAIEAAIEENPLVDFVVTGMESEDALEKLIEELQKVTNITDADNDCYIICTEF